METYERNYTIETRTLHQYSARNRTKSINSTLRRAASTVLITLTSVVLISMGSSSRGSRKVKISRSKRMSKKKLLYLKCRTAWMMAARTT